MKPDKLVNQLGRRGNTLLEQQMWCWGCDVRRSDGNLLLANGAEKRLSPDPRYHSAYTYWLRAECALTLWGWGIWISEQGVGSLFISRACFRIHSSPAVDLCPQAWCEKDLRLRYSDFPVCAHLLVDGLNWIAGYETWLRAATEPDYRERVIAGWPQRRRYKGGVAAGEMASGWASLAELIKMEEFPCAKNYL